MTIHWEAQPELDEFLLKSAAAGYTAGQIAAMLANAAGLEATANQVSGRLTRLRLLGSPGSQAAMATQVLTPRGTIAGFPAPSATPNFNDIQARAVVDKQPYGRLLADLEQRSTLRVAVLSDTHGTAVDPDAFEWALGVIEAHGADLGLHGGDLFDFNNLSDNHSPTSYTSFEDELDGGALTLRAMERTEMPWIALVANHDVRIEKRAANRIDTYMLPWVKSPVNSLVERIENIWTPDRPNHQAWWARLGDTIIAHVEFSAGVESAAGKGYKTFTERGDDYGFDSSPIRGVFAGHTHRYRQDVIGRRRILVDLDCLQRTPEYVLTGPGVKYKNPATQGVTFFTMHRGKLDLDSIEHRIFLGGN